MTLLPKNKMLQPKAMAKNELHQLQFRYLWQRGPSQN